MKIITLSGVNARGRVALVDDADYELVVPYDWHVWEQRTSHSTSGPYAAIMRAVKGRRRLLFMHTLITRYVWTDHVNHDGLDNQRTNLRPVTAAQNRHNARPCQGSSSKYKGVTWASGRGKWQAAIKVSGRSRFLGHFVNEADAALAYNAAALKAYGDYAYLNTVGAHN